MKKIITFALAVIMCLSFAACGKENDSKENESAKPKTAEDIYADTIELYQKALDKKWDADKCLDSDVNYLVGLYNKDKEKNGGIGYTVTDINKDGTKELIIGYTEKANKKYFDKQIIAMYTIDSERILPVISAGERNRYYYLKDGKYQHSGSSGADNSFNQIEEFNGHEMRKLNNTDKDGDYKQIKYKPFK